jgi:hypothetical protein
MRPFVVRIDLDAALVQIIGDSANSTSRAI